MKNSLIYQKTKRVKDLLLFFLIIISTDFVQAQLEPNVLWAKRFGGTSAFGIATDDAQNIYFTGIFGGTADFGDITLTATGNTPGLYVAKTDSSGEILWAKQFDMQTNVNRVGGIAVDPFGNVYTTGFFAGTVYFDNTISLTTSTSIQATFVVKQNNSGEVLWATKFEDINQTGVYGSSIATDTQGNIYTVGHFTGQTAVFGDITLTGSSEGRDTGYVVKQDPDGNVLWAKNLVGTDDVDIIKIILDTSGNIYITGNIWGTASFGDTTLVCSNLYNMFVAKMDAFGEVVWAKNFGEGSPEPYDHSSGTSLALDLENNIYVTGSFKGVLTANINPISSYEDSSEPFVLKTNNSGDLLLVKSFKATGSPSTGSDITIDNFNNIYIVGDFRGTIYPTDDLPLTHSGAYDGFVFKMNNLGNVEWAGRFGGWGNTWVSRITVNTEGNLYAVGHFTSATQFGSYFFAPQNGNSNVFLLKLSSEGLSINEIDSKEYKVYPNPIRDFINIELTDNYAEVSIDVFNILGQKIKAFKNLYNTENINLSDLKTGIYLLRISTNKTSKTIKIKKQ